MRAATTLAALLFLSACDQYYDNGYSTDLPVPTGVTYQVEPVGTGDAPSGILLRWDNTSDPNVATWHVYARDMGGDFSYRGSTTSPSFHDSGVPFYQYYVVSADVSGAESGASETITVDERLALARPSSLGSTSLNGAVALA